MTGDLGLWYWHDLHLSDSAEDLVTRQHLNPVRAYDEDADIDCTQPADSLTRHNEVTFLIIYLFVLFPYLSMIFIFV